MGETPCPFSLTDIDGLESSAIGGQLMASASMESPFTQGRRIDDSTVAGNEYGFMNMHHVCYRLLSYYAAAFCADINELRFLSWQENT